MIIYLVTNNIDGKSYIGMTKRTLNIRRSHHIKDALNSGTSYFHLAIQKYSPENFTWKIIDRDAVDYNHLARLEEWYIYHLKPEYNMTRGGQFDAPSIHKISLKLKGKKFSTDHKCKISSALKKYNRTEEHQSNLTEKLKGKTPWNKGKVWSLETRLKMKVAKFKRRNPMIVILLEGTDKSGKSTLAKKLSETFKLEIRHCSKPQTSNPFEEYKKMYESIKVPTVFDRSHLGEFVYSQLWRGGLSMTPEQFKELDELCLSKFRVISIHARAPMSVILERMEREKEDLLKPDQVQRCKNLFEEIMLKTRLPVLEYHSAYQQPSEIVDKLLHYF